MALFTMQLPDGRTAHIDAPDEGAAQAAMGEMLSGGGGQNTMQGGGLFDDLPTREEARGQRGAPMPGPQGDQPPPTGGAFDDIGVSLDVQMDQAFNPHNPRNRAAERPDLAAVMDDKLHGGADNQGRYWTAMNSLNMGFGDELAGLVAGGLEWAKGGDFDEAYNQRVNAVRGTIDRYAERHPVESTAFDIAGSLPTAAIPGAAAVKGANLMTKMGVGAATGAGYGAARGFGEGEGGVDNRVDEAKRGAQIGAAVGGMVPVIGAGIGRAYGRAVGRRSVPSVEQLGDAATALYQRADNAGIAVQPRALQRLTTVLPRRMANAGFDPVLHPNAARAMQVLEQRTAQGMQPSPTGAHTVFSLGEVENMRRIIREAISASSGPDKKADRLMSQRILDQFDNWMTGLQPRDMLAGGPGGISGREAIQIVQEARGLWAKKSKGEVLADIVQAAELDDDVERSVRNGFKRLAKNKEQIGRFSRGEQEAIRKVAKGGDMGWLLRAVAAVTPGPKWGAIMGAVGGGTLGPVGTLPAVGAVVNAGARHLAGRGIKKAMNRADTIVRAGGAIPIDAKAAKTAGDYATRLIGAAGQAGTPELLP